MLVKYTYPVAGDIFMPEHWPISWGQYFVTWTVKDGKAEAVTVAVHTDDLSGLPTIKPDPRPNVAASINIGYQPCHDEVEFILRTASGLLGFFTRADIDFDHPTIAWEGETEEERARLQMFSWTTGPSVHKPPLPISFDLVARCFLSAIPAGDKEVLLRFMAKGRREMEAGRYIDAIYSYFFFLETQFAPGFSDPKKVTVKFKAAAEIMTAMEEARKMALAEIPRVRRMAELLKLSDEEIIELLVATRGKLHHHALPRKTGSWHPEKHDEFEAEALFLEYLAYVVSQRQNLPIMFDDTITEQLKKGAKLAGAEYIYLVEVEGGGDRYGVNGLPNLRISVLSRAPSHNGLVTVEDGIRQEGAPYDLMTVRGYTVKTTDGAEILARYQNHTFPALKS